MDISIIKTIAILALCLLVISEFTDASIGKKILKWLIKRRSDILLLPIPIPIWSQHSPSVKEARFSWHRRDSLPWSPDYYSQVPPPYPEDYLYPYP